MIYICKYTKFAANSTKTLAHFMNINNDSTSTIYSIIADPRNCSVMRFPLALSTRLKPKAYNCNVLSKLCFAEGLVFGIRWYQSASPCSTVSVCNLRNVFHLCPKYPWSCRSDKATFVRRSLCFSYGLLALTGLGTGSNT